MNFLNRHIVTTSAGIEAPDITDALASAGIEAEATAAHLQGVARLAALVLAEYSTDQRENARSTLNRWINEVLDSDS